jgi:hypothetical protein
MGQTLQDHYSEYDILKGRQTARYSREALLAYLNRRNAELRAELQLNESMLRIAHQDRPDALANGFDETA